MRSRWIIVFAIFIWLFYDCIKPYINPTNWSFQTQLKIKCIVAICVCLIIWRLPSLDVFLQNNETLTTYLRTILQSPTDFVSDTNQRVQSGISLADEKMPLSMYTVSSTYNNNNTNTNTNTNTNNNNEKTKYSIKW